METTNNQTNAHTFSFFRMPITNTKPSSVFSLLDAYNYIVGETAKNQTFKLRSITDEKQRRNFKSMNFNYCTFSGTFQYRNDKGLICHSGLLCLDFDHLEQQWYAVLKYHGDHAWRCPKRMRPKLAEEWFWKAADQWHIDHDK